MKNPGKERLDVLVAERGLAESRATAQRLIQAGLVLVDGQRETKVGHKFPVTSEISLKEQPRFVSRGGEKLAGAFDAFPLDVEGVVCADIGASTGGFTDCLLQRGARRVYCVDVGKGQLHWRLRQDQRVVVMEEVNARYLKPGVFDPPPEFVAIDVSFISLTKILPAVKQVTAPTATIVSLIKPQFEAGREQVRRGGVVRDEAVREQVIKRVRTFGVEELGLKWVDLCRSPLKGPAGNVEFLALWKKGTHTLASAEERLPFKGNGKTT